MLKAVEIIRTLRRKSFRAQSFDSIAVAQSNASPVVTLEKDCRSFEEESLTWDNSLTPAPEFPGVSQHSFLPELMSLGFAVIVEWIIQRRQSEEPDQPRKSQALRSWRAPRQERFPSRRKKHRRNAPPVPDKARNESQYRLRSQ